MYQTKSSYFFVNGTCQTHLKHLVHKNRSPAEVLRLLNEELFPRIRKDMFVTLFLVELDTKSNKLTYARAGHEPALLVKKPRTDADNENSSVSELKGSGMALGMVETNLFNNLIKDEIDDFAVGDLLFLYTDGVTETSNQEKEEFGISRLRDELLGMQTLDPESLNQKIIQDLNKFRTQDFDRDDLTLLAIKTGIKKSSGDFFFIKIYCICKRPNVIAVRRTQTFFFYFI